MNLRHTNERFAYFSVGIPLDVWQRIEKSGLSIDVACAFLRNELTDSARILAEKPDLARKGSLRTHDP